MIWLLFPWAVAKIESLPVCENHCSQGWKPSCLCGKFMLPTLINPQCAGITEKAHYKGPRAQAKFQSTLYNPHPVNPDSDFPAPIFNFDFAPPSSLFVAEPHCCPPFGSLASLEMVGLMAHPGNHDIGPFIPQILFKKKFFIV